MTRHGLIAVPLVLLAGCAGSSPNKYYTLSVESPCPAVAAPVPIDSLEPATIGLAGVLDRPQLVVRTGPQTVDIREFDRWAEPLDQMATRVLAEDISSCRSTSSPEKPKVLLSVSIDEFMADTFGRAKLTGRWWVIQKGEVKSAMPGHSFSLQEKVDGTRSAESVAAMSRLVGRLASEIVGSFLRPEKTTPARSST